MDLEKSRSKAYSFLRPPIDITVTQWADTKRKLSSESSAEPGQWKTSRAPYQAGIMGAFTDDSVSEIYIKASSQVGKTDILNNMVGYSMEVSPCPMLFIQPTLEIVEAWSKTRLTAMLRDTPSLRKLVGDPKTRDSGNELYYKSFPGGFIAMAGANSPASLVSRPIKTAFCDEVDKYGLTGGMSPTEVVEKVKKRQITFWNSKLIVASVPENKGGSYIDLKYSQSDQRKYLVPCLNCGTLEFLKWEQVRWRDNEPLTTHYLCEHCDFKHYEKDKIGMLSNGHWEPFAEFKGMAGFFINEVSSPWVTWAKMAEDFLKAKKEEDKLKVFTTESLGKPWQVRGESPEWEKLYNRREEYPIGLVPDRGIILTAGADVQKDRIEVEVMAWGKRKENWGVETLVFSGSPFEDEVWEDMDNLIEKEYLHQQGVKLPISRLSIDSGYATEEVYNWGRKYPRKVMIVKGTDRSLSPMSPPKTIEFNYKGEKLKRSAVLWLIGVSVIKTELLRWLNLNVSEDGKEFPKGFCHFPKYEAEFFKQITAENLIKKMVRGYATYQWEKTRARNEALDNRVYNRAATYNLGIDRWTDEDWKEIAENFGIQIPGEINNNVLKSGEIINNSVDNSGVKQSKLNSGRLRKRNSFVHG